jgi:hypothetical protein
MPDSMSLVIEPRPVLVQAQAAEPSRRLHAALRAQPGKSTVGRYCGQVLEANFVYVMASGRRLRRDNYVEHGTGPHGLRFQSQEIDRLEVAEFGDIVIATMVLHDRFEIEDRTISETYRSFCVFRRHGPVWLWLGGQTCVAGPAPSPP